MWSYDKRLQFPVKIKNPDPQLAKIVISQLGGPDGELRRLDALSQPALRHAI